MLVDHWIRRTYHDPFGPEPSSPGSRQQMHFMRSESRERRTAEMELRRLRRIEFCEFPYREGLDERLAANLAAILLDPGDAAVDVGAGFGSLSFAMAESVGPAGKVFAFEPILPTANALRATIDRLALGDRIVFSDSLPYSSDGAIPTREAEPASPSPRFDLVFRGAAPSRSETPTCKLDTACSGAEHITFVRIALEEHILAALRGGSQLLGSHRPVVCMTTKLRSDGLTQGETRSQLLEFFDGLDYEIRDASGRKFGWGPWHVASRRTLVAFPREASEHGREMAIVASSAAMWDLLTGHLGPTPEPNL